MFCVLCYVLRIMCYAIIGLGNPGEKYKNTRHNTGFFIIDKLRKAWNFPEFKFEKKFNAEISKNRINGKDIILVKPQTFMNLSGQAVRAISDFYKLAPEDTIVIHDDIDISLGKYKISTDSRSAGHKGVQNIIDNLGTQKFRRIRMGIKNININLKTSPEDYVLQKFSQDEMDIMETISKDILEKIKEVP